MILAYIMKQKNILVSFQIFEVLFYKYPRLLVINEWKQNFK